LSTTQREDSIWNKELKLAQRVLTEYYDFKDTRSVEIVISYEEKEFAKTLMELFIAKGIRNVFITYTNGIICEEINKGFRKYLDDRISFYKERISEGFIRITILSPFPLPVVITRELEGYLKHLDELNFLQEYLIHSPRIMIVKPNLYWASRLGISLNELWDKVEALYDSDSLDIYKDKLDELKIEEFEFDKDIFYYAIQKLIEIYKNDKEQTKEIRLNLLRDEGIFFGNIKEERVNNFIEKKMLLKNLITGKTRS
jgi:hypothetical protein